MANMMAGKKTEGLRLPGKTPQRMYLAPCPALRGIVAHYTLLFADYAAAPEMLTLIPDLSGCLVFGWENFMITGTLWGATTQTVQVINDGSLCPLRLFVEFLPGGLHCLTGFRQADITDQRLPLDLIQQRTKRLIAAAVEESNTIAGLVRRLDDIILACVQERRLPSAVISVIDHIRRRHGAISVRELAGNEFYSAKQLNRLFQEYIGVNVKTFAGIARINYILQRISAAPFLDLDAVQTAGFYDQAHFIHSFKEICGVTPQNYRRNMSGFYNEPFKF